MSNITVIIFWVLITALFFLIVLMLWTNAKGAPWLPTPRKKVIRMLQMADVKPEDVVLDLGCGDGRVLITAARRFKAKAIGIEIDPLKAFWCKILITFLGLRKQVKVICGDFFKEDISAATVVFCYLLQSTNNKLEKKLIQELHPETRIITNTFTFQSLVLAKIDDNTCSYLYYIGNEPEKT
ncbi:MAG: class I SAM-dependent methyltransferase [Candidatus Heimdallarchaeota archaeon]|nr:class I SAM-dependent methyltransferase [Candidatus Heimdallarchaeota archaeon]